MTTEPAPSLVRPIEAPVAARRRLPPELSILGVMIGMMLLFEVLGWIFVGQSFMANPLRLKIMILQEAVIGIIAVGVTQIIIMGGIDLSSGSLVGMTAMIAASLAQSAGISHAIYPSLTGLNPFFPVAAGLACGLLAGVVNGGLIALTKIPPFIATLGMMVSARGIADWYTDGQPIGNLEESYAMIGAGWWPVVIFLVVAAIFHIALRYTRYGKFTYAIGANPLAARVSGINVERHIVVVYGLAGLLSGLAGIVQTARAISGQAGVGVGFELDAIAAAVIGGTSLSGGVGRLTGTVIGTVILGVLTSGFTFLNVDAHYQEIIKGAVIIAAVVTDQYRQRRRRSV
ncbi:MAG: ABC transporter permease [Roseiarcus sp.]